jgi:UDP-N-acetylglucosamine/UDP-N-acetylgalactosamine diphosphorylase
VSDSAATLERSADLQRRFELAGQGHVFRFFATLDPAAQGRFLSQLAEVDLDEIRRLHAQASDPGKKPGAKEAPLDLASIEPAPYVPTQFADAPRYRAVGEDLIRDGRVAAFVVAGGQGTRLGWRGPKGTYPSTVITGKPLFRVFAEQILAANRKYGVTIPWYVMTSPLNDADNWFGLEERNVFLFPQGTMPSITHEGKLLLEDRDMLAVNPDGHGGALRALKASGAIEDMGARGITQLSYFQVDNPLVRVVDPLFLGLHARHPDSSGEMSSKMVPKRDAGEKVGVFCREKTTHGSRTRVLEYSDLPAAVAQATDPDGRLRFRAGSIAIHILSLAFIDRLTRDPERFGLPFHRAVKKVPHIDLESGAKVEPSQPNAVKFEAFIFDALAECRSSLVVETTRTEEFAPIKNATGDDSPATSHQLQSDRAGAWLAACGVTVPRRPDGSVNAKIEVSPFTALDADDLRKAPLPRSIEPGAEVLL